MPRSIWSAISCNACSVAGWRGPLLAHPFEYFDLSPLKVPDGFQVIDDGSQAIERDAGNQDADAIDRRMNLRDRCSSGTWVKLQVNRESDPGRASKGNDPTTEFYQFVQRRAFRTSMAASRQIQERASAAVTSRLPSVTSSPTCRAGRLLATASAAHGSPRSDAPRAAALDALTYSMRAHDANLPQARKERLEALVTLSAYEPWQALSRPSRLRRLSFYALSRPAGTH